jgi:uncharacterized protein (DUF427 family)
MMKIPGHDHPITISPAAGRMRAKVSGHVIADSGGALALKEADYPTVFYFPRADVEMGFFAKTDRTSHCPYKGEASYYTSKIDGEVRENMIWSYEDPYPAMEAIKDYIAFYPNQAEVYAVDEASV